MKKDSGSPGFACTPVTVPVVADTGGHVSRRASAQWTGMSFGVLVLSSDGITRGHKRGNGGSDRKRS